MACWQRLLPGPSLSHRRGLLPARRSSKVVVRTGSGGFHCYYLHTGEGRKIRPDPRRPIDLIGAGPIVLPPTQGFRGRYEVIHGRVEDLAALEPIKARA
jgi:hypothetical protein